ncbi:hypothetical protein L2E82_39626 [Cichorium intybus]|uniref:Uncharacterized protein n=1 Tax=Cichorium intybus TaxID=13427 RepID=A0ACB9AJ27_CICIN|nr:hypothetical protein L2E82_39626 [Cichorium intybus]
MSFALLVGFLPTGFDWLLIIRQGNNVLQKGIYISLRHLQRETFLWILDFCLFLELQTIMSKFLESTFG